MGLVNDDVLTALRGRLDCDPLDPLAVSLTLSAPGQEVRWVFARDLLSDGLEVPSGKGDVRVRPGWRSGAPVLAFELGPQGTVFEAPRRPVEDFLTDSASSLASETVTVALALDAELDRITGAH